MKFLKLGFSFDQVKNLVYYTSRRQARRGSKGGGGYAYSVPNQWQGRHSNITVLGDRKAGATAIGFYRDPESLRLLERSLHLPVRFVSVVRNPFDVLATSLRYTTRLEDETEEDHLVREIGYYSQRNAAIANVRSHWGDDALHFVYHDRLTAEPAAELSKLCEFLEIPVVNSYLESCASIVQPRANRTRNRVDWSPKLIGRVERAITESPWLDGYDLSR